MAVPKRKSSKARKNKRRSNVWKISVPGFSKCSQCGEVVYTGTTLQKIEQILEKCKAAMTEVAIVEYQPAA